MRLVLRYCRNLSVKSWQRCSSKMFLWAECPRREAPARWSIVKSVISCGQYEVVYPEPRMLFSKVRFGVWRESVSDRSTGWYWWRQRRVRSCVCKGGFLAPGWPRYVHWYGGDDVVCGENGGFEVLEERVGKLGGPPLVWISTALNASTRGFVASKPLRHRQGSAVQCLPQGQAVIAAVHLLCAFVKFFCASALAHNSHPLTLELRERQNRSVW